MARPAILMIHGLVGSMDFFEPHKRIEQADVITCDLPGYGHAVDAPASSLSLANGGRIVAERIRELAPTRVIVLGFSMGGAVATLAIDQAPDCVAAFINVEGNLTMKDAFWSSSIAGMSAQEWEASFSDMRSDLGGWLRRCNIEAMPQRIAWAQQVLAHQPASTVYAMAHAIIRETQPESYLAAVRRISERGIPLHLVAGAKSADQWGIPDDVRHAARSIDVLADVGHFMMLEAPDRFCQLIDRIAAEYGED